VFGSAPVAFGRCMRVNRLVLFVSDATGIRNPLSSPITVDTLQPPSIRLATPDLAHFFPSPNGSSTIGEIISLCGTSMMLSAYSAATS
jgi:hypothetical protein